MRILFNFVVSWNITFLPVSTGYPNVKLSKMWNDPPVLRKTWSQNKKHLPRPPTGNPCANWCDELDITRKTVTTKTKKQILWSRALRHLTRKDSDWITSMRVCLQAQYLFSFSVFYDIFFFVYRYLPFKTRWRWISGESRSFFKKSSVQLYSPVMALKIILLRIKVCSRYEDGQKGVMWKTSQVQEFTENCTVLQLLQHVVIVVCTVEPPGNSNSDNSNSPANSNKLPFPLDLTPLFSHFYLVNSNSDNSKTPLTRTKYRFPWSKFGSNLPR